MASFDSNNLMYVTKQYEHEIQEKARQIYANDDTALVVENVEKQLNAVLEEINSKLSLMDTKIVDANQYRIGVHTQIDETKVDIKNLVDDGIEDTTSHPSSTAFKSDRSETKFSTYDFINKSINFDKNSFINLHGVNEDGNEKVHSFTIQHKLEEYMKIIEFAFTYKQYPTIMNKTSDGFKEESTVTVTRIFRGRFFIIWADPVMNPGQIIVKAIIENTDNTGNIIDKRIIDVKRSESGEDLTVLLDDGPQFDLYFTTTGEDVTISIGRLTPYKWLIRKQYSNHYGEEKVNFTIHNGCRSDVINIDEIYYSKNCDSYFIIDKTEKQIGFVAEDMNINNVTKLSTNTSITYDKSNIHRFLFKDAGKFTFITINDKSYVCINNLNSAITLEYVIDDVIELSTGEIICIFGPNIKYFDTENVNISQMKFIDISTLNDNIETVPTVIERDGKAVVFYINQSRRIAYKIREKYSVTGKYQDSTKNYSENYVEDDDLIVPEKRIHDGDDPYTRVVLNGIDTPYGIQLYYTVYSTYNERNKNGEATGITYFYEDKSVMCNFDDLIISSTIAIFNKVSKLRKYDLQEKKYDENFEFAVKKLVHTPLFTFAIGYTPSTDASGHQEKHDVRIYIIDRERIVYPINITPEYDENNNLLGYTDKNGMIYMKPEENQSEYFLSVQPYLNGGTNAQVDVYNTPNGVYIVDKDSVYLLNSDKNLKCVFATDSATIIASLLYGDKSETFGSIVVKNEITTSHDSNKYIGYDLYKNDYNIKPISDQILKNDYLDLYSDDYQLYDSDETEYEEDKPIIKFDSILYTTFVDHCSVLFNTDRGNNIEYSNTKTISDVSIERSGTFNRTEENSVSKQYNGIFTPVKLIISPNKYGFKLYKNILKLKKDNLQVSNLNDIKKYVIRRHKGDNISLQNVENTIIKLLDDKYTDLITDDGKVTIEQFVTNDKTYWSPCKFKGHDSGIMINTCMDYMCTFPMIHDQKFNIDDHITSVSAVKEFYTPVGLFILREDGTIWHSFSKLNTLRNEFTNVTAQLYSSDASEIFKPQTPIKNAAHLKIEVLDNDYKTVVLGGDKHSDGSSFIAVYNCYDPVTGNYSIPFSESDKIVKLPGNRFSIIDNNIYYWDAWNSENGSVIFKYNPITSNSERILANLTLNGYCVNIIKIEDRLHVFVYSKPSFYEMVYNLTNGLVETIPLTTMEHDVSNNVLSKIYNFKKCTILVVLNDPTGLGTFSDGLAICKYDQTLKHFKKISQQLLTNSDTDVELFEIGDRIFGNIGKPSRPTPTAFMLRRVPTIFEIISETDSITQWHNDSISSGSKPKITRCLNGLVIKSDVSSSGYTVHTTEDNNVNIFSPDKRFKSSIIHDGFEYQIKGRRNSYNKDTFENYPTIVAKNIRTGEERVIFDETSLGNRKYLSGYYYFETKDEIPNNSKTYYHLDQQNTCFNAAKIDIGEGGVIDIRFCVENMDKIFVRTEVSTNMIQLKTKVQTTPISGCTYYTKDLYNNFIEHTNLTKFDNKETYYEHECNYKPLTSFYDKTTGSFKIENNQILFSSMNPVYKEFSVNENFNPNYTYYEREYFYDKEDPESEGIDEHYIINHGVRCDDSDEPYIIKHDNISYNPIYCVTDIVEFGSQIYLKLTRPFYFLHDSHFSIGWNNSIYYLINGNEKAKMLTTLSDALFINLRSGNYHLKTVPYTLNTKYGRFIVSSNSVQLYSNEDKLILNQIFNNQIFWFDINQNRDKNFDNKTIIIEHDGIIYLQSVSGIDGYVRIYKYNADENRFVIHFETLGDYNSNLFNTEYGVYACITSNSNSSFNIYRITDVGMELKLSKSENITKIVTIPNKNGNAEIYVFTKNNDCFIKGYKIVKNEVSELKLPLALIAAPWQFDLFTISPLIKTRALLFGTSFIWYLDKNITEPILNVWDSCEFTMPDGAIETYNHIDYTYEHSGRFEEIINEHGNIDINYISSDILVPSITLRKGDPLKLGTKYFNITKLDGESSIKLPLTVSDESVIQVIDGQEYRLNKHSESEFGRATLIRMDVENRNLPIVGEDGFLYFCNARMNKQTGFPDYKNPYKVVDENGFIIKDYIKFDKIVFHNGKLYGLCKDTKTVYVNSKYSSSNEFTESFIDDDPGEALDIEVVKHIGVVYLSTKTCSVLRNFDGIWKQIIIESENSIFSKDRVNTPFIEAKHIKKTDYMFAINSNTKSYIIYEPRCFKLEFNESSGYYETSIGLFKFKYGSDDNIHINVYNNAGEELFEGDTIFFDTKCRNDATQTITLNKKFIIYETRDGKILFFDSSLYMLGSSRSLTNNKMYYVFESGVSKDGYDFIPYYDDAFGPENTNISITDLYTGNFIVDKLPAVDGYYKVRKLGSIIQVPSDHMLRFDKDTYLIGDVANNKIIFIKFVKNGSNYEIHSFENNYEKPPIVSGSASNYAVYHKLFENNAIYYNGMIYTFDGPLLFDEIYIIAASSVMGKEITSAIDTDLSLGFNLTFVSKNTDAWDGFVQDMEHSLANKLVIRLSGLYSKSNGVQKLSNLKAFVMDNYIDPSNKYMVTKPHNKLTNRFSFVLDNNSRDMKDLNIKSILTNDEVKNVLKNLINLDEYDETYNVTMEVYPAVVTDAKSIKIREKLTTRGIDVTEDYYKLNLDRDPSLPHNPFQVLKPESETGSISINIGF